MEDQQPEAGDLTDDAPGDTDQDDAQADVVTESTDPAETTEAAETTESAGSTDDDAEEAPTEKAATAGGAAGKKDKKRGPKAKRGPKSQRGPKAPKAPKQKKAKKKTGRVAVVLAAIAAALFVGSAAFAGAAVQPVLSDRATVDIKMKVAQAAKYAVTTLWSYTPEDMDNLSNRAGRFLTGDFGAQYRKFVDENVVGPNKQLKVTTYTEVTGVAVESLDGPNAEVIVYTNTTTTTPLKKNIPSMQYLSYRLSMKRDGDRWLVARMNTITSLDVTAKL